MYVKNIKLVNYRNYSNLELLLNKNVNIFVGLNAQGKTNILEGIYYCSLAKSHRTSKDKELIKWNENYAYININVCKERIDKNIEVKIFNDAKKGIRINSIKINKISEIVGVFNAVMFSPEDLKIIKDSPIYRRKLLDMELCQLSKKYYYNIVQYNKVLSERNSLLRKWNDKYIDIIDIYDKQLSNFGSVIIKERHDYIKDLNKFGNIVHKQITSNKENISFKYETAVNNIDNIENDLYEILSKNRKEDIYRCTTNVGPHRDDFSVYINDVNVRKFGSQGQQRTAVLSIKFATIQIIKNICNEYPILLLDDVLSELDSERKKFVLNSIKGVQTIITCTDIEDINSYLNNDFNVFNVNNGIVEKLN